MPLHFFFFLGIDNIVSPKAETNKSGKEDSLIKGIARG